MRKYLRIYLILFIICSSVIFSWLYFTYRKFDKKKASEYYKEYVYKGKVVDHFIDSNQHNYKTLIINEGSIRKVFLLDFEQSSLFEFIEVGDSIIKEAGTLEIKLKREDLDTLITLDIYDK